MSSAVNKEHFNCHKLYQWSLFCRINKSIPLNDTLIVLQPKFKCTLFSSQQKTESISTPTSTKLHFNEYRNETNSEYEEDAAQFYCQLNIEQRRHLIILSFDEQLLKLKIWRMRRTELSPVKLKRFPALNSSENFNGKFIFSFYKFALTFVGARETFT